MMDPIQRTNDRLEKTEKDPGKPVIPQIPNGSKKSTTPSPIPGLPEGKELTLVHGTTIPITISENTPGMGISVGKDRKVLLDIGTGVNVSFINGKLKVRANALSFLGLPFLMILGTACLGLLLGLYLRLNQPTKTEMTPEPPAAPQKNTRIPLAKKLKEAQSGLSGADKLLEVEIELSPSYQKPSDLFELIADENEAIKVYEEAIRLRKMAARNNDAEQMEQSIIRLQALLRKSALGAHHRRLTAKQLWVIYHCHLKWYKSAKEMERLMKALNKGIENHKRVLPICPKDEE